jgi:hypothetical protein
MVKVNSKFGALQCPLCRSETILYKGHIHQYLLSNVVIFIGRARRSPLKRAQYCQIARSEYEKLKTLEGDLKHSLVSQMNIKITTADLFFVEGDYETAEKYSLEAVQSNALSGAALLQALMTVANSRME